MPTRFLYHDINTRLRNLNADIGMSANKTEKGINFLRYIPK